MTFLESNPLISVRISSGEVGDKNTEFTWRSGRYFFIFAAAVLDRPVRVQFA